MMGTSAYCRISVAPEATVEKGRGTRIVPKSLELISMASFSPYLFYYMRNKRLSVENNIGMLPS